MKKKIILLTLILGLSLGAAGCQKKEETKNTQETTTQAALEQEAAADPNLIKLDAYGFEIKQPAVWQELSQNYKMNGTIVDKDDFSYGGFIIDFWPTEVMTYLETALPKDENQELSEEQIQEVMVKMQELTKKAMQVMAYQKDKLAGQDLEKITGYPNNEVLGEKDNYIYYLSYANKDEIAKTIKAEEKEEYLSLMNSIDEAKKSFKIIPVVDELAGLKSEKAFPKFEMQNVEGKKITQSIFGDAKVTMINIWATTCGPCIQEMPELQSLYQDYQSKGLNVVGIVADGEENLEDLKVILEKKGVKFTNLLANDSIKDYMLKITGTPTTVFVDKEGNFMGDPILGSRSKVEYEKVIKELLQ